MLEVRKKGVTVAAPLTPAQLQALIRKQQDQQRQAEQKQRQAIAKYNREARQYNAKLQSELDRYNREIRQRDAHERRERSRYNNEVREYNSRVRSHQHRLRAELAKLDRLAKPRYAAIQASSRGLVGAFVVVEAEAAAAWKAKDEAVLDLAEAEAANSISVANTLLGDDDSGGGDDLLLQDSELTDELARISPDLDQRWRGALFALNPKNPDAARHFCTSSRELLTQMLDQEAPNEVVLTSMPACEKTDNGLPKRRAKIAYLMDRAEFTQESLGDFANHDIDDVVKLFGVFNGGTHGSAGTYNFTQLMALKTRVEGAVRFLSALTKRSESQS